MKKLNRLVSLAMVSAFVLSSSVIAFAADSNIKFTGTPIDLSLEKAYDTVMTSGTAIETAKLNKQAKENAAEDSNSALRLLNKAIDQGAGSPTGVVGREMIRQQREYAKEQAEANYQAELNAIKVSTVNKYYTTKNTEDKLKIAQENLTVQEQILDNTKLKYNVGTVSKQDVTSAEIAVNQAKNNVTAAENGLYLAEMSLNMYFGFDLMQTVNLTDEINEVDLPAKDLDPSIQDALKNRNEIKDTAFNAKIQSLQLESMQYNTSVNSVDYIDQKQKVLEANKTNADIGDQIEMDVRNKYLTMTGAKSKITLGRSTLEQAKENLRLAQLSYDAGMNTITDVQNAQLAVFNAQTELADNLLEYNLAVMDYEISSTNGSGAQGSGQ